MVSLLSILALGFFLGMRHATDADHVIAVTTIVSRQRSLSRAALVGASWGLGHTVTIFAVGSVIILFDLVIPPRIGLSMELAVALMLIVLGLMNVISFFRSLPVETPASDDAPHVHSHAHSHGDYVHTHQHSHEPETHPHPPERTPLAALDRLFGSMSLYQYLRPLIVGIVHGLAGSAAVALLVLTTIRNAHWAIAYLLIFGVGTIMGMMLITMSIAAAFNMAGNRLRLVPRRLAMAAGFLSLGFGLLVAYQILVVHGLLGGNPQWTPH
jgi:ABC-type nickel/cobalt efflux system permease component RcnA